MPPGALPLWSFSSCLTPSDGWRRTRFRVFSCMSVKHPLFWESSPSFPPECYSGIGFTIHRKSFTSQCKLCADTWMYDCGLVTVRFAGPFPSPPLKWTEAVTIIQKLATFRVFKNIYIVSPYPWKDIFWGKSVPQKKKDYLGRDEHLSLHNRLRWRDVLYIYLFRIIPELSQSRGIVSTIPGMVWVGKTFRFIRIEHTCNWTTSVPNFVKLLKHWNKLS